MDKPRLPTKEEQRELVEYTAGMLNVGTPGADDIETAEGFVENSYIAVFDNYMSDGPGYTGKVMLVVWPGGPDLHECFTWRNGMIEHQDADIGMIHVQSEQDLW